MCTEKITEEINTVDSREDIFESRKREVFEDTSGDILIMTAVWKEGSELNTYVYDYQMVRKDNIITDQRILLRENGKKKHEVDAEPKIKRFKHHNILFGPIALLDIQWQPFYDYKIIQREKFKRDNVVVIEANPKETNTSENPFGKVWVREDDFSIVKIEWDQRSLLNLEVFERDAKIFGARPEIKFTVEYGFEKNGIRFPSKYFVVETYYREGIKYFIRSRLFVTYIKYKFFTVESEVKY
ncbi:MAG: hypothetical protein MUP98_20910 [Candidatus Aminicenantes bacterium]|nr:hypothetical protein [Candidatus Aminicenantes bacterium]